MSRLKRIFGLLLLLLAVSTVVSNNRTVDAQGSISIIQQMPTMLNVATKVTNVNTTVAQQLTGTLTPSGSNYVYITAIELSSCQDATGVAATNVTFNFTGGIAPGGTLPIWGISQVLTVEGCVFKIIPLTTPLKSISPGTAVTIQTPASSTHTAYGINVYWYEAP